MLSLRIAAVMSFSTILLGCGSDMSGGEINATPIPPITGGTGPGSCLSASYRARQGQLLQGTRGDSFTVQSVSLGCAGVADLQVEGAEFVATSKGRTARGGDFLGGTVTMHDSAGNLAAARIDGITPDPMDATGQTFLYTLVYVDAQTGATTNVCLPDATGLAAALPLHGRWDATGAKQDIGTAISLACTSGVLAKCVRWGYQPWQTRNGTALADYHQACTRMARADYCGDGQTHTQEGTQIDLSDRLSLNAPEPPLLNLFEATWTPSGAYCVSRERWLILTGLLPTACNAQFTLSIEASPLNPLDLCLMRRTGASAADVLLSDSTGINIKL